MRRSLLLLIVALLPLPACGGGESQRTAQPAVAAAWQQIADDLAALRADQAIPPHLAETATRDGSEFDVERYFDVLSHVDVEPGFVLDYVYVTIPDRAYPVLYTRREGSERFPTSESLLAATEASVGFDDLSFLDQVYVVDGTPTGFFEYVLLRLVGSHFYLYWHALEDDERVVATYAVLDELVATFEGSMDPAEASKARTVDPTPVVAYDDDLVTVELVSFTRAGGFLRRTFVIERVFPQRIVDESISILAGCDCATTF